MGGGSYGGRATEVTSDAESWSLDAQREKAASHLVRGQQRETTTKKVSSSWYSIIFCFIQIYWN